MPSGATQVRPTEAWVPVEAGVAEAEDGREVKP